MVASVSDSRWTLDAFLGLDGLVQAFGVAPAVHQAAGELVDDDDLAVFDDVVLVAPVEHVGAQRVVQVGSHLEVLAVVEVLAGGRPSIDSTCAMPSSVSVTTRSFSSTV